MALIGEEHAKSLAAPYIFIIVVVFQCASRYVELYKKKVSMDEDCRQLQAEIKQLLREANSLSEPSTFAQAAKLRRVAAAKEKELAKYLELHGKKMELSYNSSRKILMISKVLIYALLILWFWWCPVTTISEQLVQPFGKVLSWRAGGSLDGNVRVGIIPWLIVSSRVSKYICQRVLN